MFGAATLSSPNACPLQTHAGLVRVLQRPSALKPQTNPTPWGATAHGTPRRQDRSSPCAPLGGARRGPRRVTGCREWPSPSKPHTGTWVSKCKCHESGSSGTGQDGEASGEVSRYVNSALLLSGRVVSQPLLYRHVVSWLPLPGPWPHLVAPRAGNEGRHMQTVVSSHGSWL